MIQQIIQDIFHTDIYQVTKLDKGLTNDNYLLVVNQKQYVLRIPGHDSDHIINRRHEKAAIDLIKNQNIDAPLIYYNEKSGIKITEFIPNCQEFEECQDQNKVIKVAHLLRKFHALKLVSDYSFDPLRQLENYRQHVTAPIYDLSKYEKVIEEVQKLKFIPQLCHNDLVSGNLLFHDETLSIIDFEYAANNDPYFDLISFLSENQIFDHDLREQFYQAYFQSEITDEMRSHLQIWETFQNVLWCYWAMMMAESRNEQIYQDIAKDKYEALLKTA